MNNADTTNLALQLVFEEFTIIDLLRVRNVSRSWLWLVQRALQSRSVKSISFIEHYRGNPFWVQTFTCSINVDIVEVVSKRNVLQKTAAKLFVWEKASALEMILRLAIILRRVDSLQICLDYPQRKESEMLEYIPKKQFTKNLERIIERRSSVLAILCSEMMKDNLVLRVGSLELQTDLILLLDWIKPSDGFALNGFNFCIVQPIPFLSCWKRSGGAQDWQLNRRTIIHLTFMMYVVKWWKVDEKREEHIEKILGAFTGSVEVDDTSGDWNKFRCVGRERTHKRRTVRIMREDGELLYFRIVQMSTGNSYRVYRRYWANYEIATQLQSWAHIPIDGLNY